MNNGIDLVGLRFIIRSMLGASKPIVREVTPTRVLTFPLLNSSIIS
jgi:hypothetical protein